MTTPLSAYLKIAELVKIWADELERLNHYNPSELARIAADMRAFGNGLVAEVNNFSPAPHELPNRFAVEDLGHEMWLAESEDRT